MARLNWYHQRSECRIFLASGLGSSRPGACNWAEFEWPLKAPSFPAGFAVAGFGGVFTDISGFSWTGGGVTNGMLGALCENSVLLLG